MRTLLTLLCFLSSVAAAETPHARRLELPGFTDQTKQEIYKKIPSLKSGQWTQDDLDQLIQYLVLNEQYDSVAVSKESEETYKLNVGRVRRIASLGFSGNASVSESELRRETGLGEKIAFDPGALVEAGEKIRTFYEAMGFPKTQVDIKYTESKETQVAVNVIVHEGPQTMIEDFRVQTPNADLEILLRRVLRKFRNEPFTNRTLAEIRIRARESLSAGGFWRTELPEPKVQLNFEESKAVLVFAIDKSDQYFFNPQGNSKLTKSSISSCARTTAPTLASATLRTSSTKFAFFAAASRVSAGFS